MQERDLTVIIHCIGISSSFIWGWILTQGLICYVHLEQTGGFFCAFKKKESYLHIIVIFYFWKFEEMPKSSNNNNNNNNNNNSISKAPMYLYIYRPFKGTGIMGPLVTGPVHSQTISAPGVLNQT